jgi:hypothetical protein
VHYPLQAIDNTFAYQARTKDFEILVQIRTEGVYGVTMQVIMVKEKMLKIKFMVTNKLEGSCIACDQHNAITVEANIRTVQVARIYLVQDRNRCMQFEKVVS